MEFEIRKINPRKNIFIYSIFTKKTNIMYARLEIIKTGHHSILINDIWGIPLYTERLKFKSQYVLSPGKKLISEAIKDFGSALFGLNIGHDGLTDSGKKFVSNLFLRDDSIMVGIFDGLIKIPASTVRRLKNAYQKPKPTSRPKPIERPTMKINLLRKRI